LKKAILAAAALVAVTVLGFGSFTASTTQAAPTQVWVINDNVATALNGGVAPTWTAAGLTAGNIAAFDTWAAASGSQINSGVVLGGVPSGKVYIVVKTDGSTSPVALNGKGLTCASVAAGGSTAGNAICDGTATDVPPTSITFADGGQYVIWQVTAIGTFAGGVAVTATQNSVSVDSPTLTKVGTARDMQITVSKDTVQEGAAGCAIAASQSSPTNGAATATYTDINGNALIGYHPTFSTSSTSTLVVGNAAGTLAGGASQLLTTMLQADGTTIAAVDSYCGVAAGSASVRATTASTESTELGVGTATVTRSSTITVTGVPAAIDLVPDPGSIVCDGTQTSTVTAKVTDSAGNDVVDGTPVTFSVVALGTANQIQTTTTAGSASSTITPLSVQVAGVTVVVTSGSVSKSTTVACIQPTPTAPPPGPTATPTRGGIIGPETGTGGYLGQEGSAGVPTWALIALALGSVALVAGGAVARRVGK